MVPARSAHPAASAHERAVWPALIAGTTASNLAGAVFLYLLMRYALSPAVNEFATAHLRQFLVVVAIAAVLLVAGTVWIAWPVIRWQRTSAAERVSGLPQGRARHRIIRLPIAQSILVGFLWVVCGVAVVWEGSHVSAGMGTVVTLAVVLGGIASAALTYFEAERFLRPVTVTVLDGTVLAQVFTPSVRQRILAAWLLGTGLPLLGVVMVAADVGLADDVGRPADIRTAVLTLSGAGLVLGALTTWLAA